MTSRLAGDKGEAQGGALIGAAAGALGIFVGVPLLAVMALSGFSDVSIQGPSYGNGFDGTHVPAEYLSLVQEAGTRCTDVGPAVIAAQIEAESSWKPTATSNAGAQGLAQFMPATWNEWGKDYDGDGAANPYSPADAIGSQADYMCHLAGQINQKLALGVLTGNSLDLTLAAYNAGIGTVTRAGGVPDIRETRGYITKIAAGISKYSGGLTDPGPLAPGAASSIVDQAKRWLGTPYVWGGGSLTGPSKGGLDCSGLVRLALFQATGIELPRTANQQARTAYGQDIPRDYNQMRAGDIITFSKNGGGHYHHVGIYMGGGEMIHAPVPGKTVEIVKLAGSNYYENFYWTIKRYTS